MGEQLKVFFAGWMALLGLLSPAYGQEYDIRNWTVMDGLPQSEVSSITQDGDGYLWMATGSGLARFDGVNFKTYSSNQGLRDNVVTVVFADGENNLWVATEGGGVCRMAAGHCDYLPGSRALNNATVHDIFEDSRHNLWFSSYRHGLMKRTGNSITVIDTAHGLPSNTVWGVQEDNEGVLWVATDRGLAAWRRGRLQSYENLPGLEDKKIFSLLANRDQGLLIGTDQGLYSWNKRDGMLARKVEFFGDERILKLMKGPAGRLWAGTASNGLAFRDGNTWTRLTDGSGIENARVDDIFIDRAQNVWIGTYSGGVSRYRFNAWKLYAPGRGVGVLSVHQLTDGEVWTGTTDGLYRFVDGQFDRHVMPGTKIWDIDELSNGHLIFFTDQNEIYEFDGHTTIDYLEKQGLPKLKPYEMTVDRSGGLWVGTRKGAWYFKDGQKVHLTTQDGLADNMVWRIFEDKKGTLWFGTDKGVCNYKDGRFHTTLTIEDGLPHNIVADITQDEDGDYWFGTDAGVAFYRPPTDSTDRQLVAFTRREGLKYLQTQFIKIDGQQRLWQATNSGIEWFALNRFKHHSQYHWYHFQFGNYKKLEFNHRAALLSTDGHMLMGTMQGLLSLDARHWQPRDVNARLHITGVENLSDAQQSISLPSSSPSWTYNNNSLRFSYIGIDLSQPDFVEYRYRLKGFDKSWSSPTSLTAATYTNLDPGSYTFQVKASNGSGYWNIRPAEVHFDITAPFWHRWWFYTLLTVGLIGGAYIFIKVRLKILERDKLKELVDEQTRSLEESLSEKEVLIKEIHHRVKNNLAVISGLLELQMQSITDRKAKQILGESQLRIHSIAKIHEKLYQNENLSSIPFDQYIRDLLEVIEQSVAQERQVKLSLNVEPVQLNVTQAIPCGLIMNELVSNAFEHAFDDTIEDPIVEIEFTRRGKEIYFRVADNGVGLDEDFELEALSSLGLSLVDTLTQQLEGGLEIGQPEVGGTRFSIIFPYSY